MLGLVGALLASVPACHLDELLSPRTTLATLSLTPSDTLLTEEGAQFCLGWHARDTRGADAEASPVFDLASTADSNLVSVGSDDGCVTAIKVSGGEHAATIRATADTVVALATVRLSSRGP